MGRFVFDKDSHTPENFRHCPVCNIEFVHGDDMDVAALLPNDDENLNKMLDGKDYTCTATLVHSSCRPESCLVRPSNPEDV